MSPQTNRKQRTHLLVPDRASPIRGVERAAANDFAAERLDFSCAIFAPNGDLIANVGPESDILA